MSLLRKHRTTAAESAWTPLDREPAVLAGDAAHMDDDGQVLPSAYQVRFGLPGHPDGPVITVSTYVVYGSAEGTFSVGLSYLYTSEAAPGWSYRGWGCHPAREVYGWAGTAGTFAEVWARQLTAGDEATMAALPDVFWWDGTVF